MVFGTGGPTMVGGPTGGSETPMDIANGETEGDGGRVTEGMKVKAMASTEGMKAKATASTEGMKVETTAAEAIAAAEGVAAVWVEVEGVAAGKISKGSL